MITICPTVTATDVSTYQEQLNLVRAFAPRIHIDLMDGDFTPTKSPALSEVVLGSGVQNDIHVMYRRPDQLLDQLIALQPHVVIIHAEAHVDIPRFAALLRENGIKTGIALLPETSVESVAYLIPHVQHVLIFGGHLGYHGGTADLTQLAKAQVLRSLQPQLEIGWDGGANLENILQIAEAGVDVINVGSAIHKSDSPETTYATMKAKIASV